MNETKGDVKSIMARFQAAQANSAGDGPGSAPASGPGSALAHGPGSALAHGPGSALAHGPGSAPASGPGSAPAHGPGSAPAHGPGSASAPGCLKSPLHPTLSSGPASSRSTSSLPRKPALGGPTAGSLPPKAVFHKSSSSPSSSSPSSSPSSSSSSSSSFRGASGVGQQGTKALASRFSTPQVSQDVEATPPKPKAPAHKPFTITPTAAAAPAATTFHKTPPTVPSGSKPSWLRDGGGGGGEGGANGASVVPSRPPPTLQKPGGVGGGVAKPWLPREDAKVNAPQSNHGSAQASRIPSGFTIAAAAAAAVATPPTTRPGGAGPVQVAAATPNPYPPTAAADTGKSPAPPPKPLANKKPSFIRRQVESHPPPPVGGAAGKMEEEGGGGGGGGGAMPKRRPLPNALLLGPAPTKPSRPPYVNLDRFRRDAGPPDPDVAPPPPASHPSSGVAPPPPAQPAQPVAPSLPPRHPGVIEPDEEDNYDDVAVMTKTSPPTLPPTTGRPLLKSKPDEGSDGELYEDLDDRWEAAELREQEDKKKKEKEEKKRLEAEKKEQKEREKKELEAKKKFKLAAPIDVIQRARVTADSRGSRTDLALKNGDWVDLVRVQDNPEGRWLARADNGSFGYVKSDCVEVDLDVWKQQLTAPPPSLLFNPDVYDDVDHVSENSSGSRGSRVMLPPPPEEEGEIYDDVIDAGGLDVRVPPPSQFTAEGNPDHGEAITEEIYDDIDSQVAPPPLPPASGRSIPSLKPNMEEIDPKLKKKLEKEEKEFRKKFKYEGEIQVLYQVTIIPTLSMRKFGGKDLSVKPGETLDVIIKAVDGKLVCRSEEGKFGTVLSSHIVTEDDEIYDDIGDECIYDND